MKQTVNGLELWVERGGSGAPVLVLLHGAGCTGRVWDGLVQILQTSWPGSWIIPDLRGHGRSDHAADYSVGHHAADMGSLLREYGNVAICGHSMGGVIAMALASGSTGVNVGHAVAIGSKINFTDEERAQMMKISETPTRFFATRDEAIERFLLVSGLTGLIAPDGEIAASGVAEENGQFRLAADMAMAGIAKSSFTEELFEVARGHTNVVVAAGENDAMVPIPQLRDLDPEGVELTGLGHNAHVEDPKAVWKLICDTIGMDHG